MIAIFKYSKGLHMDEWLDLLSLLQRLGQIGPKGSFQLHKEELSDSLWIMIQVPSEEVNPPPLDRWKQKLDSTCQKTRPPPPDTEERYQAKWPVMSFPTLTILALRLWLAVFVTNKKIEVKSILLGIHIYWQTLLLPPSLICSFFLICPALFYLSQSSHTLFFYCL